MSKHSSDKIGREILTSQTIEYKITLPVLFMTGPCDYYYNGKKIPYNCMTNILF